MATVDDRHRSVRAVGALLDRVGLGWVHLAVLQIVVVALAARLYDLGGRVAHWDEGRVAYWTVRYVETGNVQYRPMIHGPFYHHVNKPLFEAVGATDLSMRLVVAVVGGLFPLVALLFRHRLRDVEVGALALLFALNPVLLYYSRFMRGDPLVATFMFTAFALFVYAVDTRSVVAVHAGVIFTALGFTVKENALLYLACWVGAGALAFDSHLLRTGDRAPGAVAKGYAGRARRLLRRHYRVAIAAIVEFLAIIVFFYAPRRASEPGPGLWNVFGDPGLAPEVLFASTVGAWQDLWGTWIGGDHQSHAYLPYLGDFLLTLGHGALALSLLAVLGFVVDRYTGLGPSGLVSFCFYWGFASVLGYPLVTDIKAPWATVNAVVPLAVPAAVGLALVGRWGYSAYRDADYVSAGTAALSLAVVLGVVLASSVGAVYLNPQSSENALVQYAQPADDHRAMTDRLAAAVSEGEGPHVLLYGDYFVAENEGSGPREPACARWFNALPLPWYFAANDVETACADSTREVGRVVDDARPAMVIVRESDASAVDRHLGDYESRTYRLRAWGTETTFYVHEEYAGDLPPPTEFEQRGR